MKTNEGFENFGSHLHVVWPGSYIFYLSFILMRSKKNIKKYENVIKNTRPGRLTEWTSQNLNGTAQPSPTQPAFGWNALGMRRPDTPQERLSQEPVD